jgi:hypothetical protein
MPTDGTTTNPDAPLHKQNRSQRSLKLSAVLSQRLDDLCAVLNRDGSLRGVIHRQDLLAALIALAPETVADLEHIITDYEGMKVRHALVGAEKGAKVIELRPTKPGRRTS